MQVVSLPLEQNHLFPLKIFDGETNPLPNLEEKQHRIKAIREKWAWTERRWSEVTEDTGIGNPKKSTKEKGERFFNDLTDKISELMLDLCNADLNRLYQ